MICKICGKEIRKEVTYLKHIERCKYLYKNIEDIIDMYKNKGYGLEKISNKYGVDYTRIRDMLKIYDSTILIKEDLVNHNYFKENTKEMFWLLGLLASDGNVTKDKNVISLHQSGGCGKQLIEYVKNLLQCKNNICILKTHRNPCYSIHFSSKIIKSDLEKYNIVPNKTYTFSYPECIPKDMFKYFLLGYIEGDGCVTINENRKNIKCLTASLVGTPIFINRISELLKEINADFKFCVRKHSQSTVHEIRFNGRHAMLFCEWLFEDENMYRSYKYYNYIESLSTTLKHFNKYNQIKIDVTNELKKDSSHKNIIRLSKIYGVCFQTIYTWKKNKEV